MTAVVNLGETTEEANTAQDQAFTLVNRSGEDGEEKAKETDMKTSKDLIANAASVILHEEAKLLKFEKVRQKTEAKDQAVAKEDYTEAQRLKLEIEDMKNQMTAEEKAWSEHKTKEAEKKHQKDTEYKMWKDSKKMQQETLLPITVEPHQRLHNILLKFKHNGQIQWEVFSRSGAGWSDGVKRSDDEVNEYPSAKSSTEF